jgi:hypothetical protein
MNQHSGLYHFGIATSVWRIARASFHVVAPVRVADVTEKSESSGNQS